MMYSEFNLAYVILLINMSVSCKVPLTLRAVLKIQKERHSEERSDEESSFLSKNQGMDSSLRSE